MILKWLQWMANKNRMIDSLDKLEQTALDWELLPFFHNNIRGFSVEEMTSPGYLFGDEGEDCWNWKGPVIRRQTTAYGKFFRRKAGFVSRRLLPHFINYRRAKYPLPEDSTDSMVLDIIKENVELSSTELKKFIFGSRSYGRTWDEPIDRDVITPPKKGSLESVLQRLQMGGHLCIVDFRYKLSRRGEKYGWGVAVYSTPELWFQERNIIAGISPEESLEVMVSHLKSKMPWVGKQSIVRLLE